MTVFQFLIGTVKTNRAAGGRSTAGMFQFLIGTVKTSLRKENH